MVCTGLVARHCLWHRKLVRCFLSMTRKAFSRELCHLQCAPFPFLSLHLMPKLTAYLHIWIKDPTTSRRSHIYAYKQRILKDLVNQLPSSNFFDQNYDPGLDNWSPFFWEGYSQTTRYTFVYKDLSDPSRIFHEMESSARNHIRKAKSQLTLSEVPGKKDLHYFVEKSLSRQGKKFPVNKDELHSICQTINEHVSQKTIYARNAKGEAIAALAYIIDNKKASYWLSGSDGSGRKAGAPYFLLWEAIKDCAKQVNYFDFEGSMSPQIEPVFRSFGAERLPYYRIYKSKPKLLQLFRM